MKTVTTRLRSETQNTRPLIASFLMKKTRGGFLTHLKENAIKASKYIKMALGTRLPQYLQKKIKDPLALLMQGRIAYDSLTGLLSSTKEVLQHPQIDLSQELSLFINSAANPRNPNQRRDMRIMVDLIELAQKYQYLNQTPAKPGYNKIIYFTTLNSVANPSQDYITRAREDLHKIALHLLDPYKTKTVDYGNTLLHSKYLTTEDIANNFASTYTLENPNTLAEMNESLPSDVLSRLPELNLLSDFKPRIVETELHRYPSLPKEFYPQKNKKRKRYYRRV